jgi:hypothetical protein
MLLIVVSKRLPFCAVSLSAPFFPEHVINNNNNNNNNNNKLLFPAPLYILDQYFIRKCYILHEECK